MSTKERSSADYTGEIESLFLDQELFVTGAPLRYETDGHHAVIACQEAKRAITINPR